MSFVAAIERAAHRIGVHVEHAAGELGVTQAEAHLLAQLARHGPTTVGDLHREFGHKRSTLTSLLDRLEERGLVTRTVNPDDRRSFVVATTRDGARAARAVLRVLDALEAAVQAEVSPRDTAGLHAVVDALDRLA